MALLGHPAHIFSVIASSNIPYATLLSWYLSECELKADWLVDLPAVMTSKAPINFGICLYLHNGNGHPDIRVVSQICHTVKVFQHPVAKKQRLRPPIINNSPEPILLLPFEKKIWWQILQRGKASSTCNVVSGGELRSVPQQRFSGNISCISQGIL